MILIDIDSEQTLIIYPSIALIELESTRIKEMDLRTPMEILDLDLITNQTPLSLLHSVKDINKQVYLFEDMLADISQLILIPTSNSLEIFTER